MPISLQGRVAVYPRPRGGAIMEPGALKYLDGLSPPTRGSQGLRGLWRVSLGSIPAHAGEPPGVAVFGDRIGVYPRPRGGATWGHPRTCAHRGLSPPTRGSPAGEVRRRPLLGSIPAHAGEPMEGLEVVDIVGVYPRPRGGAFFSARSPSNSTGLSPPTRGSHPFLRRRNGKVWSIPAHAGEPWARWTTPGFSRVYPRPRGGAYILGPRITAIGGLSPPTRGSPSHRAERQHDHGSIPAHAGEPATGAASRSSAWVYPRPRGGAHDDVLAGLDGQGLSPPTRGSRLRRSQWSAPPRSIPAHAGEPICCPN